MNANDARYLPRYVGQRFKALEFEEQAHVRKLMRAGELQIVDGVVVRAPAKEVRR